MRAKLLVCVLLVCSMAFACAANGSLPEVREIVSSVNERQIRLTLALFTEKGFALRVVDNPAEGDIPQYRRLASAMKSAGSVAGCNGGFFERRSFVPFGFMISNGVHIGKLDPKNWMKGMIVIRDDGAHLESTETFQDDPSIRQLMQSGPWLIRGGNAEADLSSDARVATRTFICRDSSTRWAIGISEPCTFSELAGLLTSASAIAILPINEALNLDGGPSSGLWVKKTGGEFSIPERWPVRNYVAIFPIEPSAGH